MKYQVMKNVRVHSQRVILGSFVVLWIGVLPWLCWGGWSNPHHPHVAPHFVFAKPPLYDAHDHAHPGDAEPLAGVAHPDTLLTTLLALLIPIPHSIAKPRAPLFACLLTPIQAHLAALSVPTPPPRPFPPQAFT